MNRELEAKVEEGKAYQEIQSFWRSTNKMDDNIEQVNATYTTQLREDTT